MQLTNGNRLLVKALFGFIAASVFLLDASGQQRTVEIESLPTAVRRHVVATADLPAFQTQSRSGYSVDVSSGFIRTAYRVSTLDSARVIALSGSDPEGIARSYVDVAADQFGWSNDPEHLQLLNVVRTPVSSHVLFQQTLDGVPVLHRFVKVNLDSRNRPSLVLNGFDRGLLDVRPGNRVVVSATSVRAQVATMFETGVAQVSLPGLAIAPGANPRYVWRAFAHAELAGGEWETLVDAETGSVISVRDRSFRRRELSVEGSSIQARNSDDDPGSFLAPFATGTGMAFDPDPLSRSGSAYAPPFVDSGDADNVDVNAQRVGVTLNEITQGSDNLYRLDGPFVRIVGGGALSYTPPAEATTDAFSFVRSDDRFEAVNAYYHVDKSQRYVQQLGFTNVRNNGVSVNPLALVADNSIYSPSSNIIEFGAGGVDDAEDAGVIWHEYAHALLEAAAPGLVDAPEGQALHEGWADYWAGSYLRSLAEGGQTIRTDWQNVFRWDSGDGQLWPGRRIGVQGSYPADFHCEDIGDINGDGCDIYSDGLIWASALMEIFDEVGRDVSDKLNLQSHKYLSAPATFRDGAEGLLQADEDLFSGQYRSILLSVLGDRGLVDASEFAPLVEHDPLHDTEDIGGVSMVEVTATSANATIDSVFVVYTIDDGPTTRTLLASTGADQYEGSIPLPSAQGSVVYYVEVIDSENRRAVLPNNAPFDNYEFAVGPDNTSPTISHVPLDVVSLVTWPLVVRADVDDNLAVDTVIVEFELRNELDIVQESGEFGLSRGEALQFDGGVPIDASSLQEDWSVHYSITAIDGSAASNSTRSPETGRHQTNVTLSGNLLQYDFESAADQMEPTGIWERGTVANLLQAARSGTDAFGTGVSSSYPTVTSLSSLSLPPLSLENLQNVFLVFWHWHDAEHEGPVIPGQNNFAASIWDGGNIKISIDGGAWQVIEPEGGYSGTLEPSAINPLAGQQVFGGYSFGWRREIVEIPGGGEVRIRFDFGTDNGNSEESLAYAGWFIDDLSIVTVVEPDAVAPEVSEIPPAVYAADVDLEVPPIVVKATDDVGIESVMMVIDTDSTTVSIRDTRLSMSFSELGEFFANIAPIGIEAGDRIVYRIRVRDFDGNEVLIPSTSEEALQIVYKTIQEVSVFDEAVPSGYWAEDGGGWRVRTNGTTRARSGLVLEPLTLPSNVDELFLDLRHTYNLADDLGGNIKLSEDDGVTWTVLSPIGGYPEKFEDEDHPMDQERVFSGSQITSVRSRFDIESYAGQQIRLLLDFGALREPVISEYWSVEGASILSQSLDPELEVDFELTLNASYPNPFSSATTVSYTIPEESVVQIGVYDLLGRRMMVPVFARQSAGPHTFTLDGSKLANGVYFLRLIALGQQRTQTIMVAR